MRIQGLVFFILCWGTIGDLISQDTISDNTYLDINWDVFVDAENNASEIHQHLESGGNPDDYRFMEHILPYPAQSGDTVRISVAHVFDESHLIIDDISFIEYSEDVRLNNSPWTGAEIISYPLIRQDSKLYRATQGIVAPGEQGWISDTLTGLTADDFIALDGSQDKPDFTFGFIRFGFWRTSMRTQSFPPIPPNETIYLFHHSDNFQVIINSKPINFPPNAVSDDYLYLDYISNSNSVFPVLENDFDLNGDPIRISSVDEPAFGGMIESYTDNTITYSITEPIFAQTELDFFTYNITDEVHETNTFVTVHFCYCPLQCISLFLAPQGDTLTHTPDGTPVARSAATDSLDIELFKRLRDEILLPDSTGSKFVNLYYYFAPEIMPLLIQHREDIGMQAFRALSIMQDPVRNLLEKDGSSLITQELVDSVSVFLDSLLSASSDTFRLALDSALAKLCPFDEMVGMTAAEAVEFIDCDTMSTAVDYQDPSESAYLLEQNFPNPFGSNTGQSSDVRTEIHYFLGSSTVVRIQVFDIYGNLVKTLVDTRLPGGEHIATWNGTSESGDVVPAGMYFYRFSTDSFQDTRQMILAR